MMVMRLVFRIHALQRMFQRGVSAEDIRHVLETGDLIETYPNDKPFPSRLMLGWRGQRPVHVVAADNETTGETIVVTVYEPSPAHWQAGFRKRK